MKLIEWQQKLDNDKKIFDKDKELFESRKEALLNEHKQELEKERNFLYSV